MTEEVNLPDWAADVLSLLEGHRELSTHRIVKELDFADKATAYTVLRPLATAGTILKEKRGGHLYWALPSRGHERAIELTQPDRGLKQEPTRGRLISSKNDNDAPTNRRALKKTLTLEGWKSDYTHGTSIPGAGVMLEVLAQANELADLGLFHMDKVTRNDCLEAGATRRITKSHENYDWIIDLPPARWAISVVWVNGSKVPFPNIRRFYGGPD